MIVVLSIIITFAFVAYRAFIQKIINEKNLLHQQELAHQKNILLQNIKVQESERERIAILLHDDVGSKLNILSLWINNDDTWNDERSKEVITQQIPELINATRTISHELYPVNLERFGLTSTLEELISNINDTLSITLTTTHNYTPKPIEFEVQLYRVIQEFLSNVIKHAKATTMQIQIRETDQMLSFVLADNGKGFNYNTLKKGMGFSNIESRINSLNATYKWKSSKDKGTQLIIKYLK
tara:strand:+ start:1426 stop:2145 length:720 start_codon:yes stop_codon:yes gene_type:complete